MTRSSLNLILVYAQRTGAYNKDVEEVVYELKKFVNNFVKDKKNKKLLNTLETYNDFIIQDIINDFK